MPVQPKAFQFVCPKCGESIVVHPNSDVINIEDSFKSCPKCGASMQKKELSGLSTLFSKIFS